MSERKNGRRYSFKEKKDILDYLEKHTYKNTSEKFSISETTLSRWRKEIKSGSKYNRTKIIISLPKFWLEYLNEQIEADVWEDYSDAILTIIRDYIKLAKDADSNYLERAKEILPSLVNLNPNIDSMLLFSVNDVIYKTERWESTKGISNLIKSWKKCLINVKKHYWYKDKELDNLRKQNLKSFEFQNEIYHIRDISAKHLVGVKKSQKSSLLLALKRKLTENDVYILAKAEEIGDNSLFLAMDTLKRAAMGVLPPVSEPIVGKSLKSSTDMPSNELETILQRRKEYIEKTQEIIREDPQIIIKEQTTGLDLLNSRIREKYGEDIVENKGLKRAKNYLKESKANWEKEKERKFKILTYPVLMRVATRVNIPLEPEEKKALEALEKQIGKKIERITADPEQEISRNDLMPNQNGKLVQRRSYQKLPWMHANVNFPANLFSCHYIASNGKIILLTLLNFGLSDIPSEILNLKSLTYLNCNSNNISELSKTFFNLESLGTLFLNNNQFIKVPDVLIELPRLQNLYMRNNKIQKIPVTLTEVWQARIGDPNFPPGNLIFSGNPIDRSSLSQEQLELEQKSLLDMHRHLYFVID
ncbi:MAG: leucine-rich repeat domain-containing protein [Promethearchaeota archaeon]|jgi:hypothetical protein